MRAHEAVSVCLFFGVDCVDTATDEAKKVRTAENSERLNQAKFTGYLSSEEKEVKQQKG